MSETGDKGGGSQGGAHLQPNAEMAALRLRIDALDEALVGILAQRQRQIEQAAAIKTQIGWPARIPPRVDEVLARVLTEAGRQNLDAELAQKLWTAIIEWSIAYEERLMNASKTQANAGAPREGQ
ncbi:chorismate mutase [uncultured Rhodoblastus sp.]|uniref:chorismate mutase n=1 Tax=uncultured Rhodoblastus sp. TaxID=543037 RepID=UPI0025FA9036|nr:chorismate mutase [uncultured Rhodoblastus sp.]